MVSSSNSSRLSLCHQSSFSAENTLVTIVPSFGYTGSFPLLSCTQTANVGPFTAGMPSHVPLWVAKALYRRNFCQIELPEWLSVPFLTRILKEERESTLLSTRLPYHYYEIARALDCCLNDGKNPSGKATKVVLQDLVAVRSDKLRMHFHELSRSDLVHPPAGYDKLDEDGNYLGEETGSSASPPELPIISVTGICSYELNKVGPFLQRAFSDYGFLTRRPDASKGSGNSSSSKNGTAAAGSNDKDASSGLGLADDENDNANGSGVDATSRRVSMARSRLRRFRD
mmetsp:Transcript_26053/g.57091  ORF Transcript_26053/g.57091 Transcript_26053/m.57091 type:complete len:285 (-) Transcript_26053:266-1120(-)|eukprot:CAMPEP_0168177586 /NCGR_PEP_ID=MMETSP0139_2-20121125/8556_1 /TAXON_ID=44445 /ORGANISM="Pseudo-nitzschia australis, Strain 10249 10 AB" /LENGTH=284 /DNA_ID=CAMNT_0008096693 /DNA_START=144 /DNA_END=998 /DNA_ORIENTATION=-